jgi:hypothetical protein
VKTVALVYGERRRAAFVHGGTGVFAECGVAFACSKTDTRDEVLFVRLSLNALFRTSGRKIKQWVLTSNDSGSERYVLGDGSSCRDGAVQYGASVNGSFGGSDGQGLRCGRPRLMACPGAKQENVWRVALVFLYLQLS